VRRRLAILSLATTTLVVISFLIPLGLLVRQQAENRARSEAERSAQSTVQLLALAASLEGATPDTIEAAVSPLDPGTIVVFSDGTEFGERVGSQGSLVPAALEEGATISDLVGGGWELALPVIGREGSAVVDVFVSDDRLNQGVAQAWLLLGLLGILLVAIAVGVADRLGQNLVRPIADLAWTARRLGEGDLDARARLGDPDEIRAVGESINWLAGRLEELLAEEREAAADLSHRLRTPLTALRLQAEKVTDRAQREDLLAQVDRLEEAIDRVILETRSERGSGPASSDLASVVSARIAFWRVLAEEQGRTLALDLGDGGQHVPLSAEAVEAMIDALIGNVFAHTAPGTAFRVSVGSDEGRPWLEVSDEGTGFSNLGLAKRGVSGAGSTGLGLDIVRRTAERVGGSMEMNDRPGAGAVVRVWLGPAASRTSARSRP
jgi:signal transduction histidine kinase